MKKKIEKRMIALMALMLISPYAYGNELLMEATADFVKEKTEQVNGIASSFETNINEIYLAKALEKKLEVEISVFTELSTRLDYMTLDKLQKTYQADDDSDGEDLVYFNSRLDALNLNHEDLEKECTNIDNLVSNLRTTPDRADKDKQMEGYEFLTISQSTLLSLNNTCNSYYEAKVNIESGLRQSMQDQQDLYQTAAHGDWIRLQSTEAYLLEQIFGAVILDEQIDLDQATEGFRHQDIQPISLTNPHYPTVNPNRYQAIKMNYRPNQR